MRPGPSVGLLLLLVAAAPAPSGAFSWSPRCALPLNFCAHLERKGALTPVQASLLWYIQRERQEQGVASASTPAKFSYPKTLEEQEMRDAASAENDAGGVASASTVPSIVHFVFGLDDRPAHLNFAYFLNVVSAALVLQPDRIMMHYATPPSGKWWVELQPLIHLVRYELESTKQRFGIPLHHYAHRADVIRLEALLEHGGVYLDMDSLVLKDYASWTELRELGGQKGALMGAEKIVDPAAARYTENRNHYIMVSHFHEQLKKYGPPGAGTLEGFDRIMNSFKNEHWKLWEEWRAEPAETRLLAMDHSFLYEDKCRDEESNNFAQAHPRFEWWEDYEFLCNAVMMSMPQSLFMREWLNRYAYFNDTCWNCHSVWLPTHLARNMMPEHVHMLDTTGGTFFSPGWHREDLELLYGSGDFDFSDSYAMHMWYSTANRQFGLARKVTPRYFRKKAGKRWTTYQKMVRSVIPAGLRRDLHELQA
eukprot:g875.t1